jgi:L-histidine N-alpha-methyltransferase
LFRAGKKESREGDIMNTILAAGNIEITDCMRDTFHRDISSDIFRGLTSPCKFIPSKYFYDEEGSRLFEHICHLPEYYQTRTELSILRNNASSIMRGFDSGCLIELGSGANWKISALLDAAMRSGAADICYMPVDVSESALYKASLDLTQRYPCLKVTGMIADFTRHIDTIQADCNRLFLFFGSTIGNFDGKERSLLLKNVAGLMSPGDRFLVGIDMIKDVNILERAYNDSWGVTAEFNKNILNVINRELNADFNTRDFDHIAFFDKEQERVEMHLRANRATSAFINALGLNVELQEGETILTEICKKFSRESAEAMAHAAGLKIERWFSDPEEWFSLIELTLNSEPSGSTTIKEVL